MSEQFDPNAALLVMAADEKQHDLAYSMFKDLDRERQQNRAKGTVQDKIDEAIALGFVIGAKVTRPMGGKTPTAEDIGEVVGYNTCEFGLYNGYRNPVRVKFPNTTDVYPAVDYLVLIPGEEHVEP